MKNRRMLGQNVYSAAVNRMCELYEAGNRLVISFSGGKDSCVVLEVALAAARLAGRLPVEVVMRDEEAVYPGTFEYAERVAQRPDVQFHWLVANQPVVNVFNRREPYFWVFDPLISPDKWVRKPPNWHTKIHDNSIDRMTIPERFPVAEGQRLMAVMGIRVKESMGRLYGLFSAKGHITKPNRYGVSSVWPIYDWSDGDVWKAIHEFKWDYNHAYDTMHKLGVPKNRLRIAPATLNQAQADSLPYAAKAWPRWFDRLCDRLPGVRQVGQFGRRAIEPHRQLGESWESVFRRECINEAPAPWIRERSERAMEVMLSMHAHHSTTPFPEVKPCYHCEGQGGSWRALAHGMWNGDPFGFKFKMLGHIEPEYFRQGAGTWGGTPSF